MKAFIGRLLGKLPGNRSGFTLVEMLVVVAIIVALAAVIVPTVTVLLGRGESAAREAETVAVQTAIDTMMTDKLWTEVKPSAGPTRDFSATGGNDFSIDASGVYLETYIREPLTAFCYMWDADGLAAQDPQPSPEGEGLCVAPAP